MVVKISNLELVWRPSKGCVFEVERSLFKDRSGWLLSLLVVFDGIFMPVGPTRKLQNGKLLTDIR